MRENPSLDLATVRSIAATRGIDLDTREASEVLAAVRPARAVLASLVSDLFADDDIHAFRAVLESEAPR
jgi:hypothetical protein